MPVLDLSRGGGELEVELITAPAAELLLLIAALQHGDHGSFDLGAPRLEQLEERLGEELLARTRRVTRGGANVPGHLLGLVCEAGAGATPDDLVELVERMPADELALLLSGARSRHHRLAPAPVLRRAIAGNEDAVAAVRAAAAREEDGEDRLRALLGDPEGLRDELVAVLRGWAAAVPDLLREAAGPVAREARSRQATLHEHTAAEVVEAATNGVQLVAEAGMRRVLLFPSYVFRPWVLLIEHDDAQLVAYPVPDEQLDLDRSTPPPNLVTTFKALGDEGRLRLLRRLADGPIGLKDAMEELGVAKSTAHHHLAVLRQAGLVLVNTEDNVYSLRRGQVPQVADQLARYLDVTEG